MSTEKSLLGKLGSFYSGRGGATRRAVRSGLAPWLLGAAIGWAILPEAVASNPIWINPLICGQPIASYYLGDSLGSPWYVNFEIGQTSWNYAQVGYGTAANGTGYNWGVASWYEDGEGSNKRVRRDIGGLKFTSTGSWYLICQANESGPDTYTSGSACGWLNDVTYPPASMAYFTVNALNDPGDLEATPDQSTQINLFWSRDAQSHNVMIVRKLATDSWTEPTQGTAYSVSDTIGAGTVVYNGDSTVFYDTGLEAATTYDYKFYSENYSYYSAGATASATTLKADQTIDFPAIGNQLTTNVVALSATASSGLTVDFSVQSGPANLNGTTLTFTGAGSVSVVASQAGNATYNAAPDVTNTFDVSEPDLAVVLSRTSLNVRENGEGRFFVRLNKNPGATNVVTVARASGSDSIAIAGGAALTFKPSNWSTWQAVTLAQADDGNTASESATFQVSLAGSDDQFAEASALDDDIASNVALASSGTTIAGTRAYILPQMIDGVHTARTNYGWMSWTNPPKGTVTLDVQELATVSRIRLLNWDWTYRVHRYKIESSQNGTAWTTLVDATGEDHQGWDDWAIDNQAIRYLRITDPSNSVATGFCVSELEVYGSRPPLPQPEFLKAGVNVREGGEGRFYVRLNSAPKADVAATVARSSGDENIALQGAAKVTFKAAAWNVWQPVALVAAQDANADNETATFQISGAGISSGSIVATALDDDIGENLALTGGTTISGYRAYMLAQTIDGIHNSRANYAYVMWTGTSKGTMTLDLKAVATVSRVRLLNWDWTYRVHRYKIEASQNGMSWTTLADASADDHQGWDDWAVADEQIRYLRFTGITNSTDNAICVPEWEVYGTREPAKRSLSIPVDSTTSAPIGYDVDESGPVSVLTSDGVEDETGWNAVDGDPETAWIGQKAGGGYIVVEYAPTIELSALEVDMSEGSLTGIETLYSLDAKQWQPLPEDLEANPVSLNFLWLLFPDDGTEAVPNVIEIRPNP